MLRSTTYIALLAISMLVMSGCPPPINIKLGDWFLSVQLGGDEWGLTLNPDGTVTPFEAGVGVLDGVITWDSDGHHLMITRTTEHDTHFFDAWIESPAKASGFYYYNGAHIGDCFLRKKPEPEPAPA